ncbi:hypothetical protein J4E81_000115 [Alternaria sp. BMP 2799]|uniref:uncharacterized protein n=1 Tax=Alternaria infectoria TaxID=45303 RepID=UPI002220C5C4|nr:uncharacterized protein J4E92_005723 [Alternaria infectoria]KAI4705235.1 hypothetical protein J4E81_000115 [Alternaria sp. BMP 2799]KAI4928239.1 hypothetical protein J4E92_005723 [Alternaria infectoria]
MSFITNLFGSLKNATPVDTGTLPRADDNGTPDGADEDWDFVTAHEAGVVYDDRITILLGPHRETRHHIFIADMPRSSKLLNHVCTLEPSQRYLHLSLPDLFMVKLYLKSQFTSVDSLAIEQSWSNIIKLAITADIFQDAYMGDRALAALTTRGIFALEPNNAVLLFKEDDFSLAREYQDKTGNGQKLRETLDKVAEKGVEKPKPPKLELPKPQDVNSKPDVYKRKSEGTRFGKSVLRGLAQATAKKGGDMDDKVHPTRQPSVPPGVDALKRGDASNFMWPDKNVKK